MISNDLTFMLFFLVFAQISADKTSSGRAVAKLECGVPFSYAMESSFGGMDRGQFEVLILILFVCLFVCLFVSFFLS